MEEIKLIRHLKIRDLEAGKIFIGDGGKELIIDFNKRQMTTLIQIEGINYDMMVVMYDVKTNKDGTIRDIEVNGSGEIFLTNSQHDKYKLKLQRAGLWFDE